MKIKNTENHYGLIAILFHWLMAVLIIALIIVGIYMVGLPISLSKLKFYAWHKQYGLLALIIVAFRLAWRLTNKLPQLPSTIHAWQEFAARFVHRLFYLLLFALPVTGWILTSAAGVSVSFFGFFVLPNWVEPDKVLLEKMIFIHKWVGYMLAAMIILHTAAAMLHHFYYKDNVLRRMIK